MNKELEYLLNEIKDSSQDYIGTNGCRYQDLLREELDLLVNEIERLNKKNKELKEQVVSAIRVNNICTENKSIIELQAQRYEQELTITKEKQLKERIEYLERSNNRREDEILELRKENADLDNIINELEEWLEQEYAVVKANSLQEPNNPEWNIKWNERKNTLDKIKELKGDGSNDNNKR